ncbi:hypothetical protein STCU_10237 [Strigomonas culicis]|uniref:Uncharacterized protein n=1 Tax=Strigomonas culicis TaxID=28005 RepID=S9UU15_9TRYP|nr:hypothetical protein STCU_10237 [Strigomonas culicis]|eukprot:EPY18031.1 hypothetical protein STCU_10237 [Strigomonas culicis]
MLSLPRFSRCGKDNPDRDVTTSAAAQKAAPHRTTECLLAADSALPSLKERLKHFEADPREARAPAAPCGVQSLPPTMCENGLSSDGSMSDLCLMSTRFYERRSRVPAPLTALKYPAEVHSAPFPRDTGSKVPSLPPVFTNNYTCEGDADGGRQDEAEITAAAVPHTRWPRCRRSM